MVSGGTDAREFYVWVSPNDPMVQHNIGHLGSVHQDIVSPAPPDLMFVFNPQHKQGFISRFHSGVLRNYIVEYDLERYRHERHPQLPSRLHALYLFVARSDAEQYRIQHEDHVRGRVLKRGITRGAYLYSTHDAAWIDFLRVEHMLDVESLNRCWRGYWAGERADLDSFQSMGKRWTPASVTEALFYGRLDFPNKNLSESD